MDIMSDRDFSQSTMSQEDEEEDKKNYILVIAAFKYYKKTSMDRINCTEAFLNTLHSRHQNMLLRYRDHLSNIRDCINTNYTIIKKLLIDVDTLFHNCIETNISRHEQESTLQLTRIRMQDIEKVQVTLKQIARDWSLDGELEREQCYKPIIDEIVKYYNPDVMDIENTKILVPGAGLGRLTYELAYRGYFCEGNEFSLFMLIASNFVLNKCVVENQYTFYPWVHQNVNNKFHEDQLAAVKFPDVSPTQAPPRGLLNMVAGDFLHVYKDHNYWDCVATCFFIDCANNVIDFIERIYEILKPGAIWVNLGPLLYHFSDTPNEGSIEPSYEDILYIIKSVGFKILKNERDIQTKYAQNPRSMQQSEYLSIFFVCLKPLNAADNVTTTDNIADESNDD